LYKIYLILFVFLTLFFTYINNVNAHYPEGVVYKAYNFQEKTPTIDGKDDDWSKVGIAYTINTEDLYEIFSGMGKNGSGVDLSDLAVQMKIGWSSITNSIYIWAKTYDNIHIVNKPTGHPEFMLYQDCIEINIDADHSGGQFCNFYPPTYTVDQEYRLTNSQAQTLCFAYPSIDGINQTATSLATLSSSTWYYEPSSPYIESAFTYNGITNGAGITTYEIRLGPMFDDLYWMGAENSQTHTLKQNEIFGFNTEFIDIDIPTDFAGFDWGKMKLHRHTDWNLNGQDGGYITASNLADFLLSPPDVSVIPSSWGRIKASFK